LLNLVFDVVILVWRFLPIDDVWASMSNPYYSLLHLNCTLGLPQSSQDPAHLGSGLCVVLISNIIPSLPSSSLIQFLHMLNLFMIQTTLQLLGQRTLIDLVLRWIPPDRFSFSCLKVTLVVSEVSFGLVIQFFLF
jgi:hypothetical protein